MVAKSFSSWGRLMASRWSFLHSQVVGQVHWCVSVAVVIVIPVRAGEGGPRRCNYSHAWPLWSRLWPNRIRTSRRLRQITSSTAATILHFYHRVLRITVPLNTLFNHPQKNCDRRNQLFRCVSLLTCTSLLTYTLRYVDRYKSCQQGWDINISLLVSHRAVGHFCYM